MSSSRPRAFFCFVLPALHLLPLLFAFQWDFPSNQNWDCVGCSELIVKQEAIFGMVRHAMYTESREAYLNMDHSWIDRSMRTSIKLTVTIVARERLSDTIMMQIDHELPEDASEEHFQVVFSPPAALLAVATTSTAHPLEAKESELLDMFLKNNPCWMPLHDPPVAKSNNSSNSSPSAATTANAAVVGGNQYVSVFYEHSAIFIRLPAFPFHSTCRLFVLVTEKQNPASCPSVQEATDQSKVAVNWLGNIGWANCLHPVVEHLISALHNSQLLLLPRAWENGAAKYIDIRLQNGSTVRPSGAWSAWADSDECPHEHFAWDPWKCMFISMSKCNTPELHDIAFVEHLLPDPPEGSSSDYLTRLGAIKETRKQYGDAPHLGNEWEYSRLLLMAQRPNTRLRAKLRISLSNLVPLYAYHTSSSSSSSSSTPSSSSSLVGRSHHWQKGSSHHHYNWISHAMEPCLGLHVRHGDSMNDQRSQIQVNRTFAAHVECAKSLALQMGLSNIFLATDDNTLFAQAPHDYQQFRWFTQQRLLLNFTGASFITYHSESSKEQEIANLLADEILMSRCSALVGSMDGGFFKLLLQSACGRSAIGKCPVSLDLKKCQNK